MTVGDFKQWLAENEVSDDMPLWKMKIEYQGGLAYPTDWADDIENIAFHTNTYGIALPKDKQKTEIGVAIW
jgi:hypothetical protein